MRYFRMGQSKKIASGIMAFMMLVVVMLSVFFIAVEVEHDCTGENCSVCACIEQCESILNHWNKNVVALSVILLPMILLSLILPVYTLILSMPVSRKVRLNN